MSPAAEQAVVGLLLVVLIGACFAAFRRFAREVAKERGWLLALAALVALGASSLVLVAPAFVHVNFHGRC